MKIKTVSKRLRALIIVTVPKEIIKKEGINVSDRMNIDLEKSDDVSSLWGKFKDIKKPTQKTMEEIDDSEDFD